LREELGLRVFDNRVLREIFGLKRDEVTGGCRKLHNKALNNLYCPQNIIRIIKSRRMRWVGHVARVGNRRGVYRVLDGKPEGKRPHRIYSCRWKDDCLCGLVVRVSGYRYRGPGFDPRRYQIF